MESLATALGFRRRRRRRRRRKKATFGMETVLTPREISPWCTLASTPLGLL
uniref:DAD domain-containing protein n=1 Tax=Anopheles atroparvus TaxID=41427 RepID=A0AAG5D3D1_ANOAO